MGADVVGRDAELRATARFLDSLAGQPQALLLEGEPGIGKTTLWLAAVEQARQRGFRVLLCRPSAAEAQLSYASLAERLADEMPVLLAIDDLQWLDGSSARVVEFALRRLASRAGVLGALRSAEGGDRGLSYPFPDPGRVSRMRMGPLSLGALHQMLRQRIGRSFPRPVLARIEQVSGGNPFYALELARDVPREGTPDVTSALPYSLAQAMRTRIEGIRPDVRRALLAAAALAEPTVELVQLALAAEPAAAGRLLEDAEEAGVIAIDGHRVRFTHPLLAASVYSAASPARQARYASQARRDRRRSRGAGAPHRAGRHPAGCRIRGCAGRRCSPSSISRCARCRRGTSRTDDQARRGHCRAPDRVGAAPLRRW